MFGSVARMRLKSDVTEETIRETVEWMSGDRPQGSVGLTLYRSITDPRELWVAGVFESREAYTANSDSPDQQARFERLSALFDGPPDWHDGDVLLFSSGDSART